MYKSIGQRLDELKGIGPGFDHLRIGLALSILTWHSFSISYGQDYASRLSPFPVPVLLAALLPMFFGLSGFLVMSSALRTGEVKTFITLRVLRILPALFTEVMLSALVLGPLLTVLPVGDYFSNPMFWEYLGSLVGRVRFSLPGLFLDNPAPELVNFALWTVGPEILCYVIMALLMLTGIYRSSRAMLATTFGYVGLSLLAGFLFGSHAVGEVLPSKLLIYCFLAGNLIYLWRYRIVFSQLLAAISFVAALLLVLLAQQTGGEIWTYIAGPLLIYTVAVVGLSRLPPLPFFHRGDYSYGIYIFGFPIQQAITHFVPEHREWYINLALTLPVVLLFAVASWHLIENPVLGLRKRILSKGPAHPIAARGRFTLRKAAVILALSAYGLFVVDASNVLPTRWGAKMMLYGFGLYQYKPGEPRPHLPF